MPDQAEIFRDIWLAEIKQVILTQETSEEALQEAWKRSMHTSWLSHGPCSCTDKAFPGTCFLLRTHEEMQIVFPNDHPMGFVSFMSVYHQAMNRLAHFLFPTAQA